MRASGIALFLPLFAALIFPPLASANPVADTGCRLSRAQRQERIAFLDRITAETGSDIETAQASLAEFKHDLALMNHAYLASRIANLVAATAGVVSGVGAVYEVFFAEESVSVLGITLASKKVAEAYTVSRATWQAVSFGSSLGYLVSSRNVHARELQNQQAKMVAQVKDHPLIAQPAMSFLSSPDCSAQRCPVFQPDLENAWDAIDRWHDEEERKLAKTDGRWYNPFSWEWKSHHFGKELAEVQIPWAMNVIDLLQMRQTYYAFLRAILMSDGEACGL